MVKQMAFVRFLSVVACVLLLSSLKPAGLSADTAQYFYDPLGRLVGVVDGQGTVATYQYDRVGNLLSITRGTLAAPTVTNVNPNLLDLGGTVSLTLNGSGLDFTSTVVSTHPEMVIGIPVSTANTITVPITLPNPTSVGPVTLTITAAGGTTTSSIVVRQPTPQIASLTPNSGSVNSTAVIQGTDFGTKPGSIVVTFPGPLGTRVAATVLSHSATTITVRVPFGVTSGLVTVQVGTLVSNGVLSLFDTAGPAVTSILPFDGQATVPLNTRVTATFDEQVDPATVTNDTFFVGAPLALVFPAPFPSLPTSDPSRSSLPSHW
jgi:YD repeat-containing protein